MGKRTRSQRRGSSPKNRVRSHRFPGRSQVPRIKDEVVTVVDLIHSPVHTAPLARVKLESGEDFHVVATEGMGVGQKIAIGENVSLRPKSLRGCDPNATISSLQVVCRLHFGNHCCKEDATQRVRHNAAVRASRIYTRQEQRDEDVLQEQGRHLRLDSTVRGDKATAC